MNKKELANRLNEVYRHLYANYGISSQKEFAEAIKVQRSAVSAALNGNALYLTKNLFMKICAAFPGVFNLDYLLTGEGELLADEQKEPPVARFASQPTIDQSSMVNALIAAHDAAMTAKNDLIASLRESLEDKDELIESLHEQVTELQRQLAQARRNTSMTDYTYPVGVADKSKTPRKKL